ncbi:MAG: DUF4097 family beta strand repeat protein [Acidobacteria bacterium]|nr:DUF4097 family beta strand repeat protein [Acidobacteriota bacterium]
MKRPNWLPTGFILSALAGTLAFGQGTHDVVSVAFSDPSRPGLIRVSLINGGITVKGYDGKEVIVEARARSRGPGSEEGLKRILMSATGLSVEEENNTMSIGTDSHTRAIDLTIQAPRKTSLHLKCINDGDIKVEDIQGELEINNINGSVTLSRVSGSAVAHALNGKVLVTFVQVDPKKSMSFSSMNGTIDVTFPPDLKANVKMQSDRGDIYSDFEVRVREDTPKQIVEDSRSQNGKYRVRIDKAVYGSINGGGPEIQFKNFNGAIYIRKAGK